MDRDKLGRLSVGQLAERTGKTARALRYYEELGILPHRHRHKGAHRYYTEEDIHRIAEISRLQELGVSLDEIRMAVSAFQDSNRGIETAGKLQALLSTWMKTLGRRIAELQKLETDIRESLHFLIECSICELRPERDRCTSCVKGVHQAELPPLLDALLFAVPERTRVRLWNSGPTKGQESADQGEKGAQGV